MRSLATKMGHLYCSLRRRCDRRGHTVAADALEVCRGPKGRGRWTFGVWGAGRGHTDTSADAAHSFGRGLMYRPVSVEEGLKNEKHSGEKMGVNNAISHRMSFLTPARCSFAPPLLSLEVATPDFRLTH